MYYSNRLVKCLDPSCSKIVNVFNDHEGPVLCPACSRRFRHALETGFQGDNDDESFFEYIRANGTATDEMHSYFKGTGLYDVDEQSTK